MVFILQENEKVSTFLLLQDYFFVKQKQWAHANEKKKTKSKTQQETLILSNPLNFYLKNWKCLKKKKKKNTKTPLPWVAECALTYLFLSRDRCVGVALPSARVISCLSRVALGRAEFTAATALQIRLGGGSGSTSVTAVTCLVRVF